MDLYFCFFFQIIFLLNISMYTTESKNEHLEDKNIHSSTTPQVKT